MATAPVPVNVWFDGFHMMVYIGAFIALALAFMQWRWHKDANECILLIESKASGGTDTRLVPKEGGSVSLKLKGSNIIRTWPINKLATVDTTYPGIGLIPSFLQTKIQMAWLDEDDWEPILNRSKHNERVASPDVVLQLKAFAEKVLKDDDVNRGKLEAYIETLSTSPTRHMIASPAVLGNLLHEKVSEAIMTINKDTLDKLQNIINKLSDMASAKVLYIGMVVIALIGIFTAVKVSSATANPEVLQDLQQIKTALGIKEVIPETPPNTPTFQIPGLGSK